MQKHRCNYPECGKQKTGTFALVPLCSMHLDVIWEETRRYYSKKITSNHIDARPIYQKIAPLIPWSRKA